MVNQKYKKLKEELIAGKELDFIKIGQDRGYISIVRDGSEIRYRASGKSYKFNKEAEKFRAYFLVKLIEKYGYPEKSIRLDIDVPGQKPETTADLAAYQRDLAHVVVECRKPGISKTEISRAVKELNKKARALEAKYAVLVIGFEQLFFDVKQGFKQIQDMPKIEKN